MVLSTNWGTVPLRRLLVSGIQSFARRRAMVNNLWCRKLTRIWQQKADPPHPRTFSEPRCQNYVATWYLCFRWIICLMWIAIIVCSIWEFGSYKPLGQPGLWPIYLTNWDLLLGFVQSILALALVTRRWNMQKDMGFNVSQLEHDKLGKIYWFFYTVTSTLALAVTGTYWVTVYDSKIHQLDPLNIMLHVCNSLLMICDLCVTSVPLRFRNFWWCLILVTCYLIFTMIYYLAGGVDKYGKHYIYKVLDWSKPGRTLVVCLGGLTFLIIVHCLLCYVASVRDRLFTRNSEKYAKDMPDNSVDITEQCPKFTQSEIV